MKVPVSIVVPVKNEVANLRRCLESVAWADEIFVVDSASTDGTQKLALECGAQVVEFVFNGVWPKKKNWALENLPFRNEWVFLLDADEVLAEDAADEFMEVVSRNSQGFDGYFINRKFMFMGRWLKHAYYPNWNLRLFKHRLGRFERLSKGRTDSGDNEVHEHVRLEGKTGFLKTEMAHYAFPSTEVFVEKHNRYSNWEAHVFAEGKFEELASSGEKQAGLTWRRHLKALVRSLPFRPFLRFCYVYFWQRGFLDGLEGFYFARLHGFYEFLTLVKTYELKAKRVEMNA